MNQITVYPGADPRQEPVYKQIRDEVGLLLHPATQVMPVPARIGGHAEGLNALLKSCGWEAVSNDDHWNLVSIKTR